MYYIIIAAVVGLDQLTKFFISANMELGDSHPVISGIFHLTYIQNYGAAFSSFQGMRIPLIVLTGAAIAALFVFMVRTPRRHIIMQLALSLVISGGVGNLIDRMVRGYVVDFFDFRVWPVFNVADIAVCLGCGLLLVYVLFIDGKEKDKQ